MSYTMASLFDGSGAFPLAAMMCGIEPIWSSEIEPFPLRVTEVRLPNVKHMGSVTEIKGNEVPKVDVISFGSPCQDLSVAGLRKGLKHEDNGDDETTRSGLFMEAVRIAKEMRNDTRDGRSDNDIRPDRRYPRFMLWENVPGAFSSNNGQDFRVVLEELARIKEPKVHIPMPQSGKWSTSGIIKGDGWSIGWRTVDACKGFGVAQRRRRIYLVADLDGIDGCGAAEILFEREGLSRYFTQSKETWQGPSGSAEDCVNAWCQN